MKKIDNVADIYPLTPVQQGMLFHTLSEPDSEVYNAQIRCNLIGPLDVSRFKSAWDFVIAHYPALRTAFLWEQLDEPLQIVRDTVRASWDYYDWRKNHSETSTRLDQLVQEYSRARFDLAVAPLLNFVLIQLSEESHHFIWNSHHLILDGWSTHQVFIDAFKIYNMLGKNQQPFLPPTKPFRNYIAWLNKQDIGEAKEFWQKKLAGFDTPTPLQVDKSMPKSGNIFGETTTILSPATTTALKQFSKQNRITFNTVMQGAWSLLLSRYSGQSDVVFGNTVSGRPAALPGVEKMVGMCINTLPVRIKLEEGRLLVPWLQQIQEQQLEARQYEYSPLARVQQWSDIPTGRALFDSILVFENYPGGDEDTQQLLQIKNLQRRELSNYPLAVLVFPGETLQLSIIFNRNRFEQAAVERMLQHLQTILESMVLQARETLAGIPLLDNNEREQLLVVWNNTFSPIKAKHPLFRSVEKNAAQRPEATAVVAQDGVLTYAQLDARANQLAHYLIEKGIEPGTPIGLFAERSVLLPVGIIGIQKAGGAYVPIDPEYPANRIELILKDTQAPVIVAQKKIAGQLPATDAMIVELDYSFSTLDGLPTAVPQAPVTRDDLAYVIFTSGSTGTPKGVMVTHANLIASTMAREVTYQEPVARFLLLSSFAFDSSVAGIFWTLVSGGTLILPAPDEEKEVQKLAAIIEREQVSHTLALPTLYRLLLTYAPPRSLDSLQVVIVAGEACPPDLGELHYDLLPQTDLYNEYGPTEATVWCSVYKVPPVSDDGVVPIGRPIANSQLYILDRRRQPVPIGVPGELYVGGAGVTSGYWHNPQLSAERFPVLSFAGYDQIGRVYRTGDLARWRPNGEVEFLGRVDNQVKIRGYRVEPGEIEAQLRHHPAVAETVVYVWDGSENGSQAVSTLVAYVVVNADGNAQIDGSRVREYLGRRLPDYMVPAQVVFLPALPRTPNGKVDRRRLPRPAREAERKRPFAPPQSPVEKKLAGIWGEILRLPQVSIEDRFLELGGDSIIAIQVIARARQEGLYLTPRQLFREQTIKRLATLAVPEEKTAVAEADAAGTVPLTPIQHWFFEQRLNDPAHWNQAAWFAVPSSLDRNHLLSALRHLAHHHPMLRARYAQHPTGWRQEIIAETKPPSLAFFSLVDRDPAAQDEAMLAAANELHTSLDLAKGPLLQAALFELGSSRRPRLLLIIHHLVVDAVSWTTLTSDLQTAYRQIVNGTAVALPAPKTSYAEWARSLTKVAKSDSLRREAAYWQKTIQPSAGLLQDQPGGKENTEGNAGRFAVTLDREHTNLLLRDVHKAYHTRIDDVLLTALAQAMAVWTGERFLLLTWERHGREELEPLLDVSQTVGWFTSLTPVVLELAASDDAGANLRSVKETLRSIPQNGLGFGLLRYLGGKEVREQMARLPRPQILFNYLGQAFDFPQENGLLQPLPANTGTDYGPQNKRAHLIDVNAQVADGRLEVNWQYATGHFQAQTIQRLANAYVTELEQIIDHCLQVERSRHTPSDFPLASLQQDDLDSLSDLLSELD